MRRIQAALLTSVLTLGAAVVTVPSAGASAATSKAPIVVGGIATVAAFPGTDYGFEAGIRQFNAAGGLDGRKIKFVGVLDDGGSPQTSLSDAQQLVQSDHVFAVAPFTSPVAGGDVGTFLATNKTPFMGYALNGAFLAAPTWGFGLNGQQVNPAYQSNAGALQLAKALGGASTVKVAFVGTDVPGESNAVHSIAAISTAIGEHVTYAQASIPPAGVTSYAPYAQAIINSGANAVYEILAAPDATGLAAAFKAAGWSGTVVNGVTYEPSVLASQPNTKAALQGVLVESEFPLNQNKSPAVAQEEKELAALGQSTSLTPGVSVGYWTAQQFIQMLQATEKSVGSAAKVTPAALEKRVNGGWTYTDTLSGGIGSLSFPKDESEPTGCGTLVKTIGLSFKLLATYACPPKGGIAVYHVTSAGKATRLSS